MLTKDNLQYVRAAVAAQLPAASSRAARDRAKQFLDHGVISSSTFDGLRFEDGAIWSSRIPRSHQRFVHGLLFLVDWYKTVLEDESTRSRAAVAAWDIVDSWSTQHEDRDLSPSMAYHDETTAQRLINLVTLNPYIEELVPGKVDALSRLMRSTAELLATDDFHAGGNNHGMFQDLALVYWATMCASEHDPLRMKFFEKAMARLRLYFGECFTVDGVHVENTPTYHLMIARKLDNVRTIAEAAGHPDAIFYATLIHRAEKYATHALMPDATYPPISDTQQIDIGQSGMERVFTSPEFLFAISKGKRGSKPSEKTLVLPHSGYAIYRSDWGDPDATFAFFSAAYNANYHKHSDDLSLFIRSRSIELLSESGPYSYDYKDPLSKYAYSQFAHNSLVVDGKSLPRTDDRQERVTLESVEERQDGFTVIGTNGRYDDVLHERTLEIRETAGSPEFNIVDSISASSKHEYQLLWNVGTQVSVVLHSHGFELVHKDEKMLDLAIDTTTAVAISLHEGRMRPRPLGWRFPKFGEKHPAKVISVAFKGENARLRTKIRLANFTYKPYEIDVAEPNCLKVNLYAPEKSRFAYKLFHGHVLVKTIDYTDLHSVSFENLEPGKYRIRIYEKQGGGARSTAFTTGWSTIR